MRVFLALDLSEEQRKGLGNLQKKLKKDFNGVKWVEGANMHVTLKFLGEIEENEVDAICSILENNVKSYLPFLLSLKGMGFFPKISKPRIIWVGVEEGKNYVTNIWKDIEMSLHEKGYPLADKNFTPHVTLGRIRRVEKKVPTTKWLNEYHDFSLPPTEINYLTVYNSTLQPQGAVYTPLNKIYF